MKCCVCTQDIDVEEDVKGKIVWDQGHSPDPVRDEGRCCTWCNNNLVVPLRIRMMQLKAW